MRGLLLRLLQRLQLGKLLLRVDAREDGLALVHHGVVAQHAEDGGAVPGAAVLSCADAGEDLLAALGHERREQHRADAHGLQQVVHHGCQAVAVGFVLGQHPGRRLVDILVGAGDDTEDLLQAVLELELLHLGFIAAAQRACHGLELIVHRLGHIAPGQRAAEVLFDHRSRAGDEVAQVVGKVNVDGVDQQLVGEVAVAAKREGAQQEEAQRIHAEALGQQVGIDHVAL